MNTKKHSGDCSIYASLINEIPEAGICICGYGLEYLRERGYNSELYSNELIKKLEGERKPVSISCLKKLLGLGE